VARAPSGGAVSGWGVGLLAGGSGLMFFHVSAGGGRIRYGAAVSRVGVDAALVVVGVGGARRGA
jgi:hypothetical protein